MKMLIPIILIVGACGEDQELPLYSQSMPVLEAEVVTYNSPAAVEHSTEHAVRLEPEQVTVTLPPPTTVPFDPITYVNSLTYQHYNPEPALEAYRVIAAWFGWDDLRIMDWEPFVRDVLIGESAFCWNRQRGDAVAPYSDCVITRPGRHEDVGFGQATRSLYGRNALLCLEYSVCSKEQILESPWNSMLYSVVIPMDAYGSQPWCYSAAARSYHNCTLAPDRR